VLSEDNLIQEKFMLQDLLLWNRTGAIDPSPELELDTLTAADYLLLKEISKLQSISGSQIQKTPTPKQRPENFRFDSTGSCNTKGGREDKCEEIKEDIRSRVLVPMRSMNINISGCTPRSIMLTI
jgi:hypothetical protein